MSSSCRPQPDRAIASWRRWQPAPDAAPVLLSALPGGETNRSFLVGYCRSGRPAKAVLRLNAADPVALGIDRERESRVLALAAADGLAPAVLYNDPERRFLVTDFLPGRTWSAADMAEPGNRRHLEKLVGRVQSLKPDLPPFDYRKHLENYWQRYCRDNQPINPELRAEFDSFLSLLANCQAAGWTPLLCHHDLNPENIVETPAGLYLLDWEYAALGHPDIDRVTCGLPVATENGFVQQLVYWLDRLWRLVNG